jgi:hypothetical protein
MPRRKSTDIMSKPNQAVPAGEPQSQAEISKLDLAIKLAKEIQSKKTKKEIIEEDDTDDEDVEYVIQTKTKSVPVEPVVPVEIPVPKAKAEKKPRVKKETQLQPQPQPPPQQPVSYNYEKIKYLEQENERLKNSLKFNALSRVQNFANGMKIKF